MNRTNKSKWMVILGMVSIILTGNLLAGCGDKPADQAKTNESLKQKKQRDE